MNITTVGIDLAKKVFQVHGVDSHGHTVLRRQLKRAQLLPYFANLLPCPISMESCCGSCYFARGLGACYLSGVDQRSPSGPGSFSPDDRPDV
jgi:transposase